MVDVNPSENTINITVSQAKSNTLVDTTNNMAKYYEELAETYKNNAKTWCEGTDEEVEALGGTHSAKRYSELTDQQQADWNETDTTAKSYIKNKDTVTSAISELEEDIEELEEDIEELEESKQDTLVSGTNIKSINGNSILGSGDLELDGLPSQTGNADKFLKTNGTTASWEKISLGTKFAINKGNPNLLVNNSTSLGFNVTSSTPLTYTDINGNARTVTSLDSIDMIGENPTFYENFTKVGSPTISNGVVSGFSTSDYLTLPQVFNPSSNTWEMQFKINTPDAITRQELLGGINSTTYNFPIIRIQPTTGLIYFNCSTNGTSWDIALTSTNAISSNTDHTIKIEYTGSAYNLYIDNTLEATTVSSSPIVSTTSNIIGALLTNTYPFLGSIDLKESYIKINNQLWWTCMYSVDNGTYKVALPSTGNTPTLFNGTIFNQDTTPTSPVANDIWLNPQEPYTCKQYDGTTWNDYSNVLLQDSSVTVASGVITAIEQPKYNYNGINVYGELVETPVIIETYVNGTSGYRIWSDGYCEQWGFLDVTSSPSTITLLKSYKDTNYCIMLTFKSTSYANDCGNLGAVKTVNTFNVYSPTNNVSWDYHWKTSGYLAEGEY